MRQIQSTFSGGCFIEVASFAGIWACSKLYQDNELYKQCAMQFIFSLMFYITFLFLISSSHYYYFFNIFTGV